MSLPVLLRNGILRGEGGALYTPMFTKFKIPFVNNSVEFMIVLIL